MATLWGTQQPLWRRYVDYVQITSYAGPPGQFLHNEARVIAERLARDQSFVERTNIPTPQLGGAVWPFLRSSHFQFKISFYKQIEATARAPHHCQIDNLIYRESGREGHLLSATQIQPRRAHYVEDACVIWTHGEEELFHKHWNNSTLTSSSGGGERGPSLMSQWPRMKTDWLCLLTTSQHTQYYPKTISGVLRCMRDQAHHISDTTIKVEELWH